MRRLVTSDGSCSEPAAGDVAERITAGQLDFWLDIESPDDDDYDLLLNHFHFHPLSVEDVHRSNQRPFLQEFPDHQFLILFAVGLDGDRVTLREQDLYMGKEVLVTVHEEPAPELDSLRERIRGEPDLTRGDIHFVRYLVINELVEDAFGPLEELDEKIDDLIDGVIRGATPAALSRITGLKHEVSSLRRALSAQREVFQSLLTHTLDHESSELSFYYRDVYNHLVRQYEEVDSLRDLLTGAMDVYLSTTSNRLNMTMRQLTVVASLFMPLSFLTGFFGMNFAVLVGHIQSGPSLAVGVTLMVLSVAIQLLLFRRMGWV
jgi:magnesium transporter